MTLRFSKHNSMQLIDEQVSELLHIQLRGNMNYFGSANFPALLSVNYPWVVAFIDGKWVHLFPWLKDTEVTEGKNLWDYFPEGYNTAEEWFLRYLLDDPTIRGLANEDNIASLFPIYATEQLAKNNLTLDDFGIQYVNRPHCYNK